jgi:hypothetical protein
MGACDYHSRPEDGSVICFLPQSENVVEWRTHELKQTSALPLGFESVDLASNSANARHQFFFVFGCVSHYKKCKRSDRRTYNPNCCCNSQRVRNDLNDLRRIGRSPWTKASSFALGIGSRNASRRHVLRSVTGIH